MLKVCNSRLHWESNKKEVTDMSENRWEIGDRSFQSPGSLGSEQSVLVSHQYSGHSRGQDHICTSVFSPVKEVSEYLGLTHLAR